MNNAIANAMDNAAPRVEPTLAGGPRHLLRQDGPAWVFALWHRGYHRCSARTARGGRCRRFVNLQAGVSRYCERHRDPWTPVYYLSAQQREEPCPCGCGYAVLATVLTAHQLAGAPEVSAPGQRHTGPIPPHKGDAPCLSTPYQQPS